jgi:hypothetical protein
MPREGIGLALRFVLAAACGLVYCFGPLEATLTFIRLKSMINKLNRRKRAGASKEVNRFVVP